MSFDPFALRSSSMPDLSGVVPDFLLPDQPTGGLTVEQPFNPFSNLGGSSDTPVETPTSVPTATTTSTGMTAAQYAQAVASCEQEGLVFNPIKGGCDDPKGALTPGVTDCALKGLVYDGSTYQCGGEIPASCPLPNYLDPVMGCLTFDEVKALNEVAVTCRFNNGRFDRATRQCVKADAPTGGSAPALADCQPPNLWEPFTCQCLSPEAWKKVSDDLMACDEAGRFWWPTELTCKDVASTGDERTCGGKGPPLAEVAQAVANGEDPAAYIASHMGDTGGPDAPAGGSAEDTSTKTNLYGWPLAVATLGLGGLAYYLFYKTATYNDAST